MAVIIIGTSMYFIAILFMVLYLYYKTKNGLQAFQQSGYDIRRYLRYIRSNYKYTFGINELLPIVILIILPFKYWLFELLIVIIFLYYNLKFFQLAKMRFTEKLPLKVTARVKRLLITLIILIILMISLIFLLTYQLLLSILVSTYSVIILIIIASFINAPIEKLIRTRFKKKAERKILEKEDLLVIGITGSYGKTSIKNIIFNVLKNNKMTLMTPSSFNTPMGLSITINKELTNFHEIFIAEMGAYYQGEIKELSDMVHPKIGIVSSIGPQHLETFKSLESVQKTKMELIESLPSDGLGILNYDNKYIRDYKIKNDVEIKWYSLENDKCDLYAYDIKYLSDGMDFKIKFKDNEYKIETKLLGKHSIYNILAAILVADYEHISMDKVIREIKKIHPIKNRLELKKITPKLTIIDDSFNANIEGIQEAINILKKINSVKILITPGIIDGGEDNEKLNENLSLSFNNDLDKIYIIGKYNKKALIKNATIDKEHLFFYDNFIDAYNQAISEQDEEKTILIANDLPDKYN